MRSAYLQLSFALCAAATVTETVYYSTTYVTVTDCGQATSTPASTVDVVSTPSACTNYATNPTAATRTSDEPGCGTTLLHNAYSTPHAIIPIDSQSATTSYGTQYFAYISSANSTIFNFDIPAAYSGKECSLLFLFPLQSQLETSSFTESGSGGLSFDVLASTANLTDSYDSAPAVLEHLTTIDSVTPGNSYVITTGSCAAGTSQSIKVSSVGGYGLTFFQDWNPSPIGVFLNSC